MEYCNDCGSTEQGFLQVSDGNGNILEECTQCGAFNTRRILPDPCDIGVDPALDIEGYPV